MSRTKAFDALMGVGDDKRGQWEEWTGKAFHVRRRLTEDEEKLVGDSVDIRGTPEARTRAERALAGNPRISPEWAYEEAGIKVW